MDKIPVTGASEFFGSYLTRKLHQVEHFVPVADTK